MTRISFLQKTSCGNPKEVITDGDQFREVSTQDIYSLTELQRTVFLKVQ